MTKIDFQGREFIAKPDDRGLLEIRYLYTREGRSFAGSVAAHDPARLPELLKVQSLCHDGGEVQLRPAS